MRLCLVSSILALIVVIQAESRSEWLLLLLVLSLLLAAYLNVFISPQMTAYSPFKPPLRHGAAVNLRLIILVVASIGLSAVYAYSWLNQRVDSRLPFNDSGQVISALGDVVKCDYSNPNIEKYVVNLLHVEPRLDSVDQIQKLRKVSLSRYLNKSNEQESVQSNKYSKHCGFRIRFSAKLRAPYSFINPVGFDYEAWLLSKAIDATGYITDFSVVDGVNKPLIDFRQQGIHRAASLNGLSGQVVPALLFGESGYLEKERWSDLQMTGAIHLLVVSGLHVGFLVLLVVILWRLLIHCEMLLFSPAYSYLLRLTPLILMLCCLLYAYMAGMGLAVQRSSLMLLITLLVSYYKSHWSLLDTWLWVVWLVLMINPLASLSIGFWFSFAAVGCLLMTHVGLVRVANKLTVKDPLFWGKAGMQLIRPQWVIFIALMPFLWFFQQSQSLLSLLVNTLAIPLLALCVLPLSLLALVFPTGVVPSVLNWLLALSFEYLETLAMASSWLVFKPFGTWLLCLIVLVITLLMFKGFPFRRLSAVLLALIYFLPTQAVSDRVFVFDVGQGLSVAGVFQPRSAAEFAPLNVSELNSKQVPASWVYDTGAKFRSGFSLGEAVVAKNLRALPVSQVDILFISHSDNDHAGGEAGLRRTFNVGVAYAGQPTLDDHINCHNLDPRWRLGHGFQWRALNLPATETETESVVSDNNQSCVVQFNINGHRLLLPGDIENKQEQRYVNHFGEQLKSDVLVVPHHGSQTSSSEAFLSAVSPSIAIISSGFNNPFKHPHQDVLNRYLNQGISVYNTAISGALEIDFFNPNGIKLVEWRTVNPPSWRQL